MSALNYVGLAYAAIWIGIFLFALSLSGNCRRLEQRVEELERKSAR